MPPFTVMGEHCSLCGRKNNNGTKKEVVLDRFSWDIYMFFDVFSRAKQVCLQGICFDGNPTELLPPAKPDPFERVRFFHLPWDYGVHYKHLVT